MTWRMHTISYTAHCQTGSPANPPLLARHQLLGLHGSGGLSPVQHTGTVWGRSPAAPANCPMCAMPGAQPSSSLQPHHGRSQAQTILWSRLSVPPRMKCSTGNPRHPIPRVFCSGVVPAQGDGGQGRGFAVQTLSLTAATPVMSLWPPLSCLDLLGLVPVHQLGWQQEGAVAKVPVTNMLSSCCCLHGPEETHPGLLHSLLSAGTWP